MSNSTTTEVKEIDGVKYNITSTRTSGSSGNGNGLFFVNTKIISSVPVGKDESSTNEPTTTTTTGQPIVNDPKLNEVVGDYEDFSVGAA